MITYKNKKVKKENINANCLTKFAFNNNIIMYYIFIYAKEKV